MPVFYYVLRVAKLIKAKSSLFLATIQLQLAGSHKRFDIDGEELGASV